EEFVSGIPYRRLILKAFSDIATRAAGTDRVSLPLVSALPDLHLHLVGPDKVKMHRADERALMESAEILEILGSYGIWLARDDRLVREACRVLGELAEIASWYGYKRFIARAKGILKKLLKEYDGLSQEEKRLPYSKKKLKLVREAMSRIPSV